MKKFISYILQVMFFSFSLSALTAILLTMNFPHFMEANKWIYQLSGYVITGLVAMVLRE